MQSPTDKRWSQTQNYRSHDVLPRKEAPFGIRTMGVVIRGNMLPKLPKMALNGQFQAKTPKYENRNNSKTTNPTKKKNSRIKLRPTKDCTSWVV